MEGEREGGREIHWHTLSVCAAGSFMYWGCVHFCNRNKVEQICDSMISWKVHCTFPRFVFSPRGWVNSWGYWIPLVRGFACLRPVYENNGSNEELTQALQRIGFISPKYLDQNLIRGMQIGSRFGHSDWKQTFKGNVCRNLPPSTHSKIYDNFVSLPKGTAQLRELERAMDAENVSKAVWLPSFSTAFLQDIFNSKNYQRTVYYLTILFLNG